MSDFAPRPGLADAATAFAAGDLHAAALGPQECWQKCAGLGMLGLAEPALAGLERFENDEARFHRAASLFIAGRDADALAELGTLGTAEAEALATLVAKEHIDVLAQLPYRRGAPHVLIEGLSGDPKFRVANHTVSAEDLPSPPDASVFDWYDSARTPDFYICTMLEWHMPPADIHRAPFPVFAQTADTDIHVQLLRRWLPSFDALLVTDTTEHAMVSRLVPDRPVAAAPSPFGWSDAGGSPDPARRDRPIDVFMSGIMLRPFFPDKVRFLVELLREKDLNVFIVDGAVDRRRYLEIMARAKTTLCYTRNQQALVTRGIDALGVGCVPVVPRDNVLKLSMPEACSFEYAPDFSDIVSSVRAAIDGFDRSDPEARAAGVRRTFAPDRVASRYLRALTVRAALTTAVPESRVYEPRRDTRRNAQYINWPLPEGPVAQAVYDHNVRLFRSRLRSGWTSEVANNLAREFLVQCAEARRRGGPERTGPRLRYALKILDMAIARDPGRLVLWLNYIRAARFLGDDRLRDRARTRLTELLSKDPAAWTVSVHDDIMPPDYSDHLIDQHAYFDALTRIPVGSDAADAGLEGELVRIVLASLHWLAGWVLGEDRHFASAYRLNPAYGPIAFDFALSVLRGRGPLSGDVAEAARTVLGRSHFYAHLAAIVVAHEDRVAPYLTADEIETCHRLAETYSAKVLPIETSNFSRGIGRVLSYGGPPPKPSRLLDRIAGVTVGLVACDFEAARPFRDTELRALGSGPYAGVTRAAGFLHPDIALDPGPWRAVVGNTLAVDFQDLLLRAVGETRGTVLAFVFDAPAFADVFQERLLAQETLERPIVMVGDGTAGEGSKIVGIVCRRAALEPLRRRPKQPGLEGWFDTHVLVRSLRDHGVEMDVWGPEADTPSLVLRDLDQALPANRRYFAEAMSQAQSSVVPWMKLIQPAAAWLRWGAGLGRGVARSLGPMAGALRHQRGQLRTEDLFDAAWYAARYPDVPGDGASAFRHYMTQGAGEGRDPHPLFDAAYYLEQCADAGLACTNPLTHFIRHGAHRGLNPNPLFDTRWYLRANARLATDGVNPLDHYIRIGAPKGRDPGPGFDARWYAAEHPEAAAGGSSALAHYLTVGAAAGHAPRPRRDAPRESPI